MKLFLLVLFSTCYAIKVDTEPDIRKHGIVVAITPEDSTEEMFYALGKEGLNAYAQLILMRHAELESHYGTKGIARKNGYNWWNATCKKSYKGKKRMAYEYEHGRKVKKYWYVWDTPEIGAKQFIKFLRRRYPWGIN